jgi:hypothetical protein
MRTTIKKTLLYRLAAQAEEADVQGLEKLSEALTTQISKNASNVRNSDVSYIYSSDEFKSDIEEKMWDIVIRASDFYNITTIDAKVIQPLVEKYAQDLKNEIAAYSSIKHGVGAYEPTVPGEINEKVSMEICEEEV